MTQTLETAFFIIKAGPKAPYSHTKILSYIWQQDLLISSYSSNKRKHSTIAQYAQVIKVLKKQKPLPQAVALSGTPGVALSPTLPALTWVLKLLRSLSGLILGL